MVVLNILHAIVTSQMYESLVIMFKIEPILVSVPIVKKLVI